MGQTAATSAPCSLSDLEIIDKAKRAKNGQKFTMYWDGGNGHKASASEGDLALCSLVAFYTGPDPGRIDQIFRASGRFRSKWNRPDYRERTIRKALAGRTTFYDPDRNGHNDPEAGDSASSQGRQGSPQDAAAEPWEPAVPLTANAVLPMFPTDALPAWLSRWVNAEAEALQVPRDLPGMLALGVAGAAIAGKYRVMARAGWEEPTNLFVVCCLPPGERKSTAFAHATAPVEEYEAELCREEAPRIAQKASEHQQLEARHKHIVNRIAKEEDSKKRSELQQKAKELAQELANHVVPDIPQLVCDDVTPEKLGNLLARQGGRILQASAEGTAFEIAKGRYSETANFDVYLKGHSGDPLRTGRMSRDSELVIQPALSCALAVQPDVIHGLAENASMRGRGFLARWLYSVPVSQVGHRKVKTTAVPREVSEAYRSNMLSLWQLKGLVGQDGKPTPNWLAFSPSADGILQDFQQWLEPQLAEGEDLSFLAGWGNKLAGTAVRIAGILHMAAIVSSKLDWSLVIGEDVATQAITLARDYLLPHAKAAFGQMGSDRRLEDASRVVAWLPRCISLNSLNILNGVAPFTVSTSEVHVGVFGGRKKVEQVEEVMGLLVKLNYLRPREDGPKGRGRGRSPSPRFEVNPAVLAAAQR
jgi:hypothetical protein